jgi:uncharacterized membrane protein
MKEKMKKVLLFTVICLSLIWIYPSNTYALTDETLPSQNSLYNTYDYVIDNYDINMVVNENNTLDITETITVYFNVAKHGIYRIIPLKNTITRLDGTTSKHRAQISNISVNNEYKTSKENDDYKIQIGSLNTTVTGKQTYVIKYTYNLGKDSNKEYDELYYNLIGSDWDTVIGNITFEITMPKEFDSSQLEFSKGKIGTTDNTNIFYTVDGNVIKGSYQGILNTYEFLTVRLKLENGYFVGAGFKNSSISYFMFLIPLISVLIAFLLWHKFGKDNQIVETIEFYPPEDCNSLDVAFLYKGKANKYDVISLLIYLANKGYLEITEFEKPTLFRKSKDFKITKLKEYDGNDANENLFLTGLFSTKDTVTSADLYDRFYITIDSILSNVNTNENKNKIFEKSTFSEKIIVIVLMILSLISITMIPTLEYGSNDFVGIATMISILLIFSIVVVTLVDTPKVFKMVWLIINIFVAIPIFRTLPIAEEIVDNKFYLVAIIFGLICTGALLLLYMLMEKRTTYGNEVLGKIKGFKTFLTTAEKEQLEAMIMQNPTYFYDILSYTYVLGVSDRWIKNFENISLKAPTWYNHGQDFHIDSFNSFMDDTMVSVQNVMTSRKTSSFGSNGSSFGDHGSSSSGGISGGGSGGGGGGAW